MKMSKFLSFSIAVTIAGLKIITSIIGLYGSMAAKRQLNILMLIKPRTVREK